MGRLFGTDGVRGVANTEITCELAMQIGRAAGTVLTASERRARFLIGCDTRASGDMLAAALAAGITSVGADAVMLGIVPTPAVAYLVSESGADAGVMISASHNPAESNGIKIFASDGYKLPDCAEEEIESLVLDGAFFASPTGGEIGRITYDPTGRQRYIRHLAQTAQTPLNGLKIALDCANGSASATAQELFSSLGAEVHMLHDAPDGVNINEKCGSTHPESLGQYVTAHGLNGGAAFDGDADRCMLVDENGALIDGDMILSILASAMKEEGTLAQDSVVGTVMTNFGFTRFCREQGIRFLQTKVGDRYVLEEMRRTGAVLGGEQSGHIILSEYATTGDGQLTAVQMFAWMAKTGMLLSALNTKMRPMPQVMLNLRTDAEGKRLFAQDADICRSIENAHAMLGEGGRILVRPSGTEPLIRVMAEGDDAEKIRKAAENVADLIEMRLGAHRE